MTSEKALHSKVVKFIFECSEKLLLRDLTVASACRVYHTFFEQLPSDTFEPYTVATTAIYHATKLEEQPTRIRDVVNVCHRVLHPDDFLELDKQYWDLRDSVAAFELFMLRVNKFDVACVHPHKYLLHHLLALSHLFPEREWTAGSVADVSWAFVKDSYLNSACLRHSSELFSIAVIHLALQCCEMEVPFSGPDHDQSTIPWWKAMCEECTEQKISEIQLDIADVYTDEK